MDPPKSAAARAGVDMAGIVDENIRTLLELRSRAEQSINRHQRFIESVSAFAGRPFFFYAILFWVVLWILANGLMFYFQGTSFDPPPFFWLQGSLSLAALLMTVVVLTAQARQGKITEQNAQLDLHVTLLAEQKIAKTIELLEELRRDLPSVQNRRDPEAEAMKESANPHSMAKALEEQAARKAKH